MIIETKIEHSIHEVDCDEICGHSHCKVAIITFDIILEKYLDTPEQRTTGSIYSRTFKPRWMMSSSLPQNERLEITMSDIAGEINLFADVIETQQRRSQFSL